MVKRRSAPWEDMEMDAIHSLLLILRGSLQDDTRNSLRPEVEADDCQMIVSVPGDNKILQTVGELQTVTMPIFAVDASGCINGWNAKAAEITGLSSEEAVGLSLAHLVMDEAIDIVKRILSLGLQGIEEKNVEIKFKTYDPQEKNGPVLLVVNACCSRDTDENIIGICFFGDDVTAQKMITDKYTKLEGDYAGIVRSPCPLVPPIFMTNEEGICVEWNDAMEKLSGFNREAAVGNMLVGEVFTVEDFGCRVKDHDTLIRLRILLNRIMAGENVDKISFGFFGKDDRCIDALLSANARTDSEWRTKGAICFLHVASAELQYALQRQKFSEQAAAHSVKMLSYMKILIRNPICGMTTARHLMEKSDLSSKQRELVRTRELCEDQLAKIVNDSDISAIEEGYLIPDACEFNLGEALDAVMSQVMSLSHERQVQVIHDPLHEIPPMYLMGDNLRLQQALADFLSNAVRFAPVSEGSSVVLSVLPRKEQFGKKIELVHLEFRITHPVPGIPQDLIQEMFHHSSGMSREGLGLYISHKLIKIMNGTVQYLRSEETSAFPFLVDVEFPLVN
ncbi:Phytochrome C-like protein [Drosera capensis]